MIAGGHLEGTEGPRRGWGELWAPREGARAHWGGPGVAPRGHLGVAGPATCGRARSKQRGKGRGRRARALIPLVGAQEKAGGNAPSRL